MKLSFFRLFSSASLATVTLLLGACATMEPIGHKNSFSYDPVLTPPKDSRAIKLKLSTSAQRLYVVEGNTVLLATPVSVGSASSPTPHGNFTIYSKQATKRRQSEPDAGYPMTYWMEFKPAYGIHWGFVKPVPCTHGCVRTPLKAVRKIYALVSIGTPLNIARTQPWDETIGKKLPVLNDGPLPNPPKSYLHSSKVFSDALQGKMWNF